MRNYNSHLSDDSGSGVKLALKNVNKTINDVTLGFIPGFMKEEDNGLEYAQSSVVRQASDLFSLSAKGLSALMDTLTAFWRGGSSAAHPEPDYESYVLIEDSDYNSGYYVLNNYNWKIGGSLFTPAPDKKSAAAGFSYGVHSMFNPGLILNDYEIPLLLFHDKDIDSSNKWVRLANNPTVKNIVQNTRGRAVYNYEDFMYCAELGKVSNSHLITLRRFAAPCSDNIFDMSNTRDLGHMCCYFGGTDNKLEDILRMNFHATWKKFTGKWQEQNYEVGQKDTPLGSLANILSSLYRTAFALGNINIDGHFTSKFSTFNNKLQADYFKKKYEQYDQNKIYTPKNIVNETHQYEGMMEFSNTIRLKFRYKMRSYYDINLRAAFMDLIGNILATTYRRADFWGGGVWWKGAPPNLAPYNVADQFIKAAYNKVGGVWNQFFDPDNRAVGLDKLLDMFANGTDSFKPLLELFNDFNLDKVKNFGEKALNAILKFGSVIGNLGLEVVDGGLRNFLGRPAVYCLNSILTGAAVGPWHITIGNPFNPIAAIGNLIIDDVLLQFGNTLGIDDFPEEIECIVTLKHAKPRELSAISHIFMHGMGEISTPLSPEGMETLVFGSNAEHLRKSKELGNELKTDELKNTLIN